MSWGPSKIRGSFDFETWNYGSEFGLYPRCCGLMWGAKGERHFDFIEDEAARLTPKTAKSVAIRAFRSMHAIAKAGGPAEWWAHNGGKYDDAFMLQAACDLGWECSGHVAAGRLVVLKMKAPGEKILTFYDSMAVVPSALKRAAKDFKLESQKLLGKDDYALNVRKWTRKRLRDGCKADCAVVLELLDKVETLLENYGGELRATFSSAALTVVESRVELPDMRPHRAYNEIARQAYAGGRVEVFHHDPPGWLAEWDVTSSYPWSMTQRLPFRLIGAAGSKREVQAVLEGKRCDGIVRAKVRVPVCEIPLLPYLPRGGGMFFPVGQWTAWFQAVELREAMKLGVEVSPLEAIAYTVEAPFTSYVEELFSKKATSRGAERELMKLLLNGSYGKFAQRPERENLRVFSTEDEAELCAIEMLEELRAKQIAAGGDGEDLVTPVRFLSRTDARFCSISVERWAKRTHYALAGAVTANSRILLHRFLRGAEKLAYCDTDSIHADCGSDLPVDSLLGGLKLELARMKATFYAPKIYELHHPKPYCEGKDFSETGETCGGEHYACKGFPVEATAFRRVVASKAVKRKRFRLAKSQLHNNGLPGMDMQHRRWAGFSTKRRPLDDGSTVPWTVEELQEKKHEAAVSPVAKQRRKSLKD